MDDASKENSPGCGSGSGIGSSSLPQQQDWQLRATFVEKQHMFDKVVTPSDVGKLNRLVIPKQHAEKYFPLDASANQKGLLLSFEDRTGKTWRFRYSYWNSSQSYVMTKGWSRFVKEKRLDAGDTVSFGRGVGEAGREHLFIDWKRRPETLHDPTGPLHLPLPFHTYYQYTHYDPSSMQLSFSAGSTTPWIRGAHLLEPPPAPVATVHDQYYLNLNFGYNNLPAASPSKQCLYPRPITPPPQLPVVQVGSRCIPYAADDEGGDSPAPMVFESVAASEASSAAAKRVRLFGVNLYCSSVLPEFDAEGKAAAYETSLELPAVLPSPQLSMGSSNSFESQNKDKQPMSLDYGDVKKLTRLQDIISDEEGRAHAQS